MTLFCRAPSDSVSCSVTGQHSLSADFRPKYRRTVSRGRPIGERHVLSTSTARA